FEREQPAYAPIDEEHPAYPESSYALSKLLSEELGRQLQRWTGAPYVALRFSNIMEPHDYEDFPSYWDDPSLRRWNLWGYVDARVHLIGLRRARDHRRDRRLGEQTADRDLQQREAARPREFLQRLEAVEGLVREHLVPSCKAGALRTRFAAAVFPGQQSTRQREVREDADAEPLTGR